eukprot:gnl/TRDRNA2_/TRDRNA2_42816_c0_seq1.p1 gnl/TRDRNA2_/TRDRNA2_42816_c0~~gnl/TRDRNA2_/TRDRNA2_42816_c0_seq1.p1  ORF type:complete len:397 (+),score=39.31 gnl/TRDRNA2_/TRDRNA2_42816_c0_seq1:70-1260(+)
MWDLVRSESPSITATARQESPKKTASTPRKRLSTPRKTASAPRRRATTPRKKAATPRKAPSTPKKSANEKRASSAESPGTPQKSPRSVGLFSRTRGRKPYPTVWGYVPPHKRRQTKEEAAMPRGPISVTDGLPFDLSGWEIDSGSLSERETETPEERRIRRWPPVDEDQPKVRPLPEEKQQIIVRMHGLGLPARQIAGCFNDDVTVEQVERIIWAQKDPRSAYMPFPVHDESGNRSYETIYNDRAEQVTVWWRFRASDGGLRDFDKQPLAPAKTTAPFEFELRFRHEVCIQFVSPVPVGLDMEPLVSRCVEAEAPSSPGATSEMHVSDIILVKKDYWTGEAASEWTPATQALGQFEVDRCYTLSMCAFACCVFGLTTLRRLRRLRRGSMRELLLHA